MTFLSPLALALLALLAPIFALYLLKLRRQDRQVSSLYLWQRFVRDIEANAPWQRLRRNLLLLLQVLFMLALVLALARPAEPAEGLAGQAVVLIVDTSASMAAMDGNPDGSESRLDAAKAAARELLVNLPEDTRVTLLAAAGGSVETLVSASQDRRQAMTGLAGLRPTALGSDLTPALALAEALVARQAAAEILLLSDGAVQLPATPAAIRFFPVGREASNQAISALSAGRASDNSAAVFVQVSNYSRQPAQRRLVLLSDGAPFTAFDLALAPGEHVSRVVETLPPHAQVITARLEPAQTDLLALDDRAWLVLRQTAPVRVTLVTTGNIFLQTALSLLNESPVSSNVALTTISPEDWQIQMAGETDGSLALPADQLPGLTIFDAFVPETLPPGDLLFFAPPASVPGLFEVQGRVDNPLPFSAGDDQPLLRNVRLEEIQILNAVALVPGDWSRTVVAGSLPGAATGTEPVPLLAAGEIDGRRVAVLAFDLHQSDLPLRPAWPILAANLVDYLAPGTGRRVPVELAPGETFSLVPPAGIERVRLATPFGEEQSLATLDGRTRLPPLAQPGPYRLIFEPGAETVTLAVNFFNPPESDITPRPNLAVDWAAGRETVAPALPPAYREWWRPLALVALALLVLEWLVYRRSTVVQYLAALGRRTGRVT